MITTPKIEKEGKGNLWDTTVQFVEEHGLIMDYLNTFILE